MQQVDTAKAQLEIGQTAWFASYELKEKWVTCPDCVGQKALTIIMGDGTQHSIDCVNCKRGYESPTGFVRQYDSEPAIERVEISGVMKDSYGKTEYRSYNRSMDEKDVFLTQEEATARSLEKAEIAKQEENERHYQKHDRNRKWAWNASYHRQCVKRAEKDLAYHTAKLNVAKVKAKETA